MSKINIEKAQQIITKKIPQYSDINNDCIRKKDTYKGQGGQNQYTILIVCVSAQVVLSLLCGLYKSIQYILNKCGQALRQPNEEITNQTISDLRQPLLEVNESPIVKNKKDITKYINTNNKNNETIADSDINNTNSINDNNTTSIQIRRNTYTMPIYWQNNRLYSYWKFVLIYAILSSIIIQFYIRIPQYAICINSINWKEVLMDQLRLRKELPVSLVLSVYNPNIYNQIVDSLQGTIHYNNTVIANFSIKEEKIYGYYIHDAIVENIFYPNYLLLLEQFDGYKKKNIMQDVNLKANASLQLTKFLPLLHLPTIQRDFSVNIFDTANSHPELCLCKSSNGAG